MRTVLFGLVMLQAALLAIQVYLLASHPSPLTLGTTAFVVVMLVLTTMNWRTVR